MVLSGVTDGDRLCVLLPAETKTWKKGREHHYDSFRFLQVVLGTESQHICSLSSELAFVSCFSSFCLFLMFVFLVLSFSLNLKFQGFLLPGFFCSPVKLDADLSQ